MSSVRSSAAARLAAKFTEVVVLPTPPFWFATARITGMGCEGATGPRRRGRKGRGGSCPQSPHLHDPHRPVESAPRARVGEVGRVERVVVCLAVERTHI